MGRPKAWLDFAGQPLLLRMLDVLAPHASPLVVVAASDQALPPLPDGVLLAHDSEPHLGPLAGMAAGLEALPAGCDWAFVSACDSPLLASGWIDLLMARRADADIVMPVADGREQPLSALYRRTVAATARALLAADRRRPVFLCERHPTVIVDETALRTVDPRLCTLRNANTPEDYATLLADWG